MNWVCPLCGGPTTSRYVCSTCGRPVDIRDQPGQGAPGHRTQPNAAPVRPSPAIGQPRVPTSGGNPRVPTGGAIPRFPTSSAHPRVPTPAPGGAPPWPQGPGPANPSLYDDNSTARLEASIRAARRRQSLGQLGLLGIVAVIGGGGYVFLTQYKPVADRVEAAEGAIHRRSTREDPAARNGVKLRCSELAQLASETRTALQAAQPAEQGAIARAARSRWSVMENTRSFVADLNMAPDAHAAMVACGAASKELGAWLGSFQPGLTDSRVDFLGPIAARLTAAVEAAEPPQESPPPAASPAAPVNLGSAVAPAGSGGASPVVVLPAVAPPAAGAPARAP